LICHDPDVPSRGDDVNQADREVPASLPRVDFFHWLLIDLPSTLNEIEEAAFSRGFTARGKPGPDAPHGARQGINDYTGWFAGNADMAGQYFGYDGPFPPFNDSLLHHYVFTLYAVDVPRLEIVGEITGAVVRAAIAGKVLAQAAISGVYTLNRRLLSGAGA
jgi:Raf kinase inhibitor-like YbhB/YbcL family protein